MKKLLIICSVATFCLNFSAFSQKVNCKKDTVTAYKYGFSNYKVGFKSSTKVTPSRFNAWRRIISYNQTIPELYAIAIGAGNTIASNRVIIDVREPEKLNKKYCFELNVPPHLVNNIFTIMHQNLLYQFSEYNVSVEYINGLQCLKISDKEEGIILNPVAKNNN